MIWKMQYLNAQFQMYFLSMNNFKDCIYYKNADLKNFCTIKIGGKAKHLFITYTTNALLQVCSYCHIHNIKYKVIGLGANLLFDDKGFNGAIIVNRSEHFLFKNNTLYVDSGAVLSNIISECTKRNLSGFEYFAGIPSTIGGGIVNSLGAFEHEFSNLVEYVICYKKSNLKKRIKIKKNECNFGYRTSLFKNDNYIITRIKFNLCFDNHNSIIERINLFLKKKTSTQPTNKLSAGSIFKRSNLIPSKVIDELGMKGEKIGGAEISIKHAGFIINNGNAKSKDVLDLIKYININVFNQLNQKFELEIEYVPF